MVAAALILAVCALSACVYLWLELQKKLSSEDVAAALQHASDELSKTYARSYKEIETEWTDMYEKFKRIMGRADKVRGLEVGPAPQNAAAGLPATGTRSDLLRKHRGGPQK
jgi:uncharacterized protein HemX